MSGNTAVKPIDILLVDDNLEDARVTIQSLNQDDIQWRVTLVGDVEDGMPAGHRKQRFAVAPPPDLILLDMDLPEKNGRQVLAGIRLDQHLSGVPVVVLTGLLAQEAACEAGMLHADGFVTKPLSSGQFSKVVESICQSQRATRGLPPVDSNQAATTQESGAVPAPTPVTVELLSQPSASLSLPASAV
jgi:two-component system, chemotaxis family, response regulator Rcp1